MPVVPHHRTRMALRPRMSLTARHAHAVSMSHSRLLHRHPGHSRRSSRGARRGRCRTRRGGGRGRCRTWHGRGRLLRCLRKGRRAERWCRAQRQESGKGRERWVVHGGSFPCCCSPLLSQFIQLTLIQIKSSRPKTEIMGGAHLPVLEGFRVTLPRGKVLIPAREGPIVRFSDHAWPVASRSLSRTALGNGRLNGANNAPTANGAVSTTAGRRWVTPHHTQSW